MKRKLLVIIAVIVACCGVFPQAITASQAKPPEGINPCVLLTQADVEEVLGEKVKPGRLRDSTAMSLGRSCTYFTTDSIQLKTVKLSLSESKSLAEFGLYDSAATAFNKKVNALKGSEYGATKYKPVSGFGDEAFWLTNTLHILKGDVYLRIKVAGLPAKGKGQKEVEKKVAQKSLQVAGKIAEKVIRRLP